MTRAPVDYAERDRDVCAASMQEALSCLEGRWKMMILAHLSSGDVMRFSDLQRAIPDVSQKMLIQQLRALERDRIVVRRLHPQVPPKVEYGLTPLGRSLRPVFLALLDWSEQRIGSDGGTRPTNPPSPQTSSKRTVPTSE